MVRRNEESEDNSDTQSSTDESRGDETLSTQENTVDSTVNAAQTGKKKKKKCILQLTWINLISHGMQLKQINKIHTKH